MALALLPLMTACHKKEKMTGEEAREILVEEAFTDSVILYKTYPGYLTAEHYAEVMGLVNGLILSRNYQPGQYVKKGQSLFTIDPTLYKDAVARAEATLKSNESTLAYSKQHYEAVLKALEDNAVSRIEVLEAENAYKTAEASVNDSRAALHTAQVNLGYCSVLAPLSGYISDATMSAGNYISGGTSPVKLAEIYDNIYMYAVFEIEESQYKKISSADGYNVDSPVYSNIPLQFSEHLKNTYVADLIYEAPNVERSTGTITLKGKIVNIDNELKQGMFTTISLPYGDNPKAVLVKDASIGTDQLGRYMYVVNDSNKITTRRIEAGELYHDSLRVVTKGIQPGDKYVAKALLTVRAGETIKPVLIGAPAAQSKENK